MTHYSTRVTIDELDFDNRQFMTEVYISGFFHSHPGDNYSTPPDAFWTSVEVDIIKASEWSESANEWLPVEDEKTINRIKSHVMSDAEDHLDEERR